MIENNKHRVFADEYIITNDPIVSYQKSYPKASSESARVNGYKLLQNATIAEYIAEAKEKIKNARENNLIETLKAKDSANILTREKFVEMTLETLSQIIAWNSGLSCEFAKNLAQLFLRVVNH